MATIPGKFMREVIFLEELRAQSAIALRARDRLRSGAVCFNDFVGERDFEKTGGSPFEILRSAHSFLTHAAIIYRLLYSPSYKPGQRFAERLRHLLDINDLPKLKHAYTQLRHKFEHVDEQLHAYMEGFETDRQRRTYEAIRAVKSAPDNPDSFLRWITPDPLRITFNKVTMRVDGISEEIERVEYRVRPAMLKLRS